MLEHTFPDMATIMRQAEKDAFKARQRWERRTRVLFSKTIRAHMRDPALFSPEKVWTSKECELAEALLYTVRNFPELPDDSIVARCSEIHHSLSLSELEEVWKKLHSFPHVFESICSRLSHGLRLERPA